VIPEELRRYAEDPAAYAPAPEPGSGWERVLTDRYCLMLGPTPSMTSASRLRLDPDEIPETLAEVRELVRRRGHRALDWSVGTSATPADLTERLLAHGLVADDEPHATSMVLVDEPPQVDGVEARRIESLDEFLTGLRIGWNAFGTPPEVRAEFEAVLEERFAAERAGLAPRNYLAFLDGEPVGTARSVVDPVAALLIGGAVVAHARGRGVYRALVRARWDDAVAAGTRALVVQAGAMSRPILERMGFEPVAEHEILRDP
jgi:GNAT superfamily N-acetyltransferase